MLARIGICSAKLGGGTRNLFVLRTFFMSLARWVGVKESLAPPPPSTINASSERPAKEVSRY
jgi:hypothetical protein